MAHGRNAACAPQSKTRGAVIQKTQSASVVFLLDQIGRNSYFFSMKGKLSEKGQVTIPKPIRDRLGLTAGQELDFTQQGAEIRVRKVAGPEGVTGVYGMLSKVGSSDEIMRTLRGEPGTD